MDRTKNTIEARAVAQLNIRAGECEDYWMSERQLPEVRLVLDVIYRALLDYQRFWNRGGYSKLDLLHARQARSWIYSSSTTPFSFVWCCIQGFSDPHYGFHHIRQQCSKQLPSKPFKRASLKAKDSILV